MHYEPTYESVSQHPVPEWFHDAKLGIFIHWGLYSVPAWAPVFATLCSSDSRLSQVSDSSSLGVDPHVPTIFVPPNPLAACCCPVLGGFCPGSQSGTA